jgi:hypothetical protein
VEPIADMNGNGDLSFRGKGCFHCKKVRR